MSKKKEPKPKKAVDLTTKEALRKLFPPPVVKEAKKVADEQRKDQ
jgi:Na+/H+-translocating membrane pyrophosphatase